MFISLLWIQGSWKWTQARILQDKYNFRIFETWARIRKLAKEDSDLWRKIKEYIDAGKLIPIDIIKEILENYMKCIWRNHNVIFDWIPRNQEQKDIFQKYVKDVQVIHFDLSKANAMERILWRTICSQCNKTFAADYTAEECASCNGEIVRRNDDLDPKSIEKRIDIFEQETMPIVYEYKGAWDLITVDASGSLEDVAKEVAMKLDIKK